MWPQIFERLVKSIIPSRDFRGSDPALRPDLGPGHKNVPLYYGLLNWVTVLFTVFVEIIKSTRYNPVICLFDFFSF